MIVEDPLMTETPFPSVRKDTLPEGTHYRDTGCNLHPACLTCPRAVCKHDELGDDSMRDARNAAIIVSLAQGRPARHTAAQFGVSVRLVYRIGRAARERAA